MKEQVESRRRIENESRRREEEQDACMITTDMAALTLDRQRQEVRTPQKFETKSRFFSHLFSRREFLSQEMRIYYRKMADFWRYQEIESKSKQSECASDYPDLGEPGPSSARR